MTWTEIHSTRTSRRSQSRRQAQCSKGRPRKNLLERACQRVQSSLHGRSDGKRRDEKTKKKEALQRSEGTGGISESDLEGGLEDEDMALRGPDSATLIDKKEY